VAKQESCFVFINYAQTNGHENRENKWKTRESAVKPRYAK